MITTRTSFQATGSSSSTSIARTFRALGFIIALAMTSASQASAPAIDVVTQPSAVDPIVNIRVVFRAGSRADPVGKEGLTTLTASLMTEATRSHSADALRTALFPWAAELDVQSEKDTTTFIGRVHRDHLDRFLALFLQVMQAPRLAVADFERLRAEQLSSIENELRGGDDEQLVRAALEVALYDRSMAAPSSSGGGFGVGGNLAAGHPYRHHPLGTVAGLKAISHADVVAHFRRTFTVDRVFFGMNGGFAPRHAALVTSALEALPKPLAKVTPMIPPPKNLARTLTIIEKPAQGTPIALGFHVGVTRRHPDYFALKVAEAWFGEHRSRVGWLFNNMRERRGLNYGDYAYVEHFSQDGWSTRESLNIGREQQYFSMWIRPVEHKNRHFALRQAIYELERFAKDGIPDDESFESVTSFLKGYWRSKEEDPMRALGYALDDVYYKTPGARAGLHAALGSLTRDDVNRAIQKHLRTDNLAIVVSTDDGEAFARAVAADTSSPIEYPAPAPAAILDEDKSIVEKKLGIPRGRIHVIPPTALFER